jgi:hypothetical protein
MVLIKNCLVILFLITLCYSQFKIPLSFHEINPSTDGSPAEEELISSLLNWGK